jgi:hypothetical protein
VNGQSYNSTHPLCFDDMLQGEFFLILNTVIVIVSLTSFNYIRKISKNLFLLLLNSQTNKGFFPYVIN